MFALDVSAWVNSPAISMPSLRGRVVVIEAFQMLCPGCVSHGLPLAQRIHRAFPREQVVVLGLHTVFEHHTVMGREALEVFLSEYRIDFPVAIDRAVAGQAIPATMQRYGLRGTPSLLVIDREGELREVAFGQVDELALGVLLGQLLSESVGVGTPDDAAPIPASAETLEPVGAGGAVIPSASAMTCDLDGTCR